MIGQLNIFGKDKVQVAIERFKAFEPLEGYFLAFSGGKDSVVIKALADMAAAMEQAGVPKHGSMIIADCAEPKTIAELASYGYNMQPSYKATRKAEQLQKLKGYKICVTKRSLNAIRELREYCWMRTKDGQWLNEPQPFNDHYADCFRYACFTYLTQFANAGQYSYGFGTISGG